MEPSLGHQKEDGKISLLPKLSIYGYAPKEEDIEAALGTEERTANDKNSWLKIVGATDGRHKSS